MMMMKLKLNANTVVTFTSLIQDYLIGCPEQVVINVWYGVVQAILENPHQCQS